MRRITLAMVLTIALLSCQKEEIMVGENYDFNLRITVTEDPDRTGDEDDDGGDEHKVTGKITDTDGNPIPNAPVELDGEISDETDVTDDEGVFEFDSISSGDYLLKILPDTPEEQVSPVTIP